MAGRLGCGSHRAFVAVRGAARPFAELDYSTLGYGRVLDDMSSATLTIAADAQCCSVLGDLREWRHELWVYRDDHEVWRGPVTPQPTYTEVDVTVPAKDHFAWFEHRFTDDPNPRQLGGYAERLFGYRNADLAHIFTEVLRRARLRDPHPALVVEVVPSGIIATEYTIDPTARPRAADTLRSLAREGVDFTVLGQRILVGSPEVAASQLTYLTTDVVSGVAITPLPTASEVAITGSNTGAAGQSFFAAAGYGGTVTDRFDAGFLPVDPLIGLVIEADTGSELNTQDAVTLAAITRYEFHKGEPVAASMVLDAQAPVDFSDLVPGAKVRLDVESTCRTLHDTYRLTKVDVVVTVNEGDETETVTIEVAPLGTVA